MHEHNHSHHHHDEELLPLVKYMVNHNISHTKELNDLSCQLHDDEKEILKEAIEAYEKGNKLLADLLNKLEEEN